MSTEEENLLLKNEGSGFFEIASGHDLGLSGESSGAGWGDYDNDGNPDLYVSYRDRANVLLRNDAGALTDATTSPLDDPNVAAAVAWLDYDNNGHLDLYLVNEDGANRLFHNNGDGSFTDVTSGPEGDLGEGRAVACGDYDSDGDIDLYLSNRGPNKLLRNDGGIFQDVTAPPLDDTGLGKGVSWADYDNDGDLDLYLVNQSGANRLFRNLGDGSFEDATTGPLTDADDGRDCAWGDFDNDGDLDLLLANYSGSVRLLDNDEGTFTDISCGVMEDWVRAYGVAVADYDDDGDLDFYVPTTYGSNRMYRNIQSNGHHWSQVKLIGNTSNRDGIGARIRIKAVGRWQMREVNAGAGYLSQNSLLSEFGLGMAARVDSLVVHWPSGIVDRHHNLPVDVLLEVHEGGMVPSFLADYSVALAGGGVKLTWSLMQNQSDHRFTVYRADQQQGWFRPVTDQNVVRDGARWIWLDTDAPPGGIYRYRVDLATGSEEFTLFESSEITVPALANRLYQNHPNPFNPETKIRYTLSVPGHARLSVYTIAGRLVATLVNETLPAGRHEIRWDGRDDSGQSVASGTYFFRFVAGNHIETKRMTLLK